MSFVTFSVAHPCGPKELSLLSKNGPALNEENGCEEVNGKIIIQAQILNQENEAWHRGSLSPL